MQFQKSCQRIAECIAAKTGCLDDFPACQRHAGAFQYIGETFPASFRHDFGFPYQQCAVHAETGNGVDKIPGRIHKRIFRHFDTVSHPFNTICHFTDSRILWRYFSQPENDFCLDTGLQHSFQAERAFAVFHKPDRRIVKPPPERELGLAMIYRGNTIQIIEFPSDYGFTFGSSYIANPFRNFISIFDGYRIP